MEDLYNWAKYYLEQGFSVIPVIIVPISENNPKGNKISAIEWKEFQNRHPTLEELEKWFKDPNFPALRGGKNKLGIAIVTGKRSGNLAVIDFDSEEVRKEVLAELKEKHPDIYGKLLNTWIAETGKGYHHYVKVVNPDHDRFSNRIGIRPGVDIRANGGYVVAPPSPHPSGKVYRFVNKPDKIAELTWEEYLTLLSFLEGKKKIVPKVEIKEEGKRELEESKIVEIVNLLRPIYKVGYRDLIIFSLTGWLKKAGISYNSARKIVELLAEKDEELNHRIYVLDRTYGLRGNPPTEEELKGKTGLQEIAETLLGEERALDLIRRLEELLGRSSPFQDSIFSLIDFRKRAYYVANPRKGIIARAFEDKNNGGIVYEKIVAEVCPVKVIVYEDPLGGLTKFEIEFHGFRNLTIGPAELDVIISRLQAEGVVKHSRLLRDALSSIITAFIRKGKAEIRRELEKPGFYYIDGQIKAVKWQPEDFSKEDLAKSLQLLNELRTKWYRKAGERFTTMIKWGLIAPFAYAIKQIRRTVVVHFPDLVAYGSRDTGKTTVGAQIIPSIWNPPEEARIVKGGGDADTKAKHGRLRSLTTFPVVVNEVEGIFNNKELLEDYKNAVENRFVRGKHAHGVYIEIPSLAPFFMTMNAQLPLDEAVRKRFFGIHFSLSDRISKDEMEKFKEEILPRLEDLRFLGYFVFEKISENPELLRENWSTLATQLLREAFEFAELDVPDWIYEFYEGETEEEVNETINEEIRSRLLENINNLYSKYISKIEVISENPEDYYSYSDLETRFRALLKENLVPWAFTKGDEIVITTSVMKILKDTGIDSLKSLAERFGWEYKTYKVNKRVVRGIKVSIAEFVEFLRGGNFEEISEDKDEKNKPTDDRSKNDVKTEEKKESEETKEDKPKIKLDEIDKQILGCYKIIAPSVPVHAQPEAFAKLVVKKLGDSEDIKERIFRLIEHGLLPEFYKSAIEMVSKENPNNENSSSEDTANSTSGDWIKVKAIDYVNVKVNGRVIRAFPDQIIQIRKKDYLELDDDVKGFLIPIEEDGGVNH